MKNDRLINLNAIIDVLAAMQGQCTSKAALIQNSKIWQQIKDLPAVDAVSIVRCKDCKHRPMGEDRDDLKFPDDKCPCKCEDYWYSWKPSDNWFCGNGERKDSNYNEG